MEINVQVQAASNSWQKVPAQFYQAELVNIFATGSWYGNPMNVCGPTGYNKRAGIGYEVVGAHEMCLVLKIIDGGNEFKHHFSNSPNFDYRFNSDNGQMFFKSNDDGGIHDNSGQLNVRINIDR